MKQLRDWIFFISFIGTSLIIGACTPVSSSELRSTNAEDLTLYATIYEYSSESDVEVSAAMHTNSGANIDFDEGQTLSAYADAADGQTDALYLSNGGFLNLDYSYDGTIDKTLTNGYYYVTYTDADGVATTASVQSKETLEINNLTDGDSITANPLTVTWDPISVTGTLTLTSTYSSGGVIGVHTQSVSNTGSASLDLDGFVGTGDISLHHVTTNGYAAGFDDVTLTMRNISKREVNYAIPSSGAAALKRDVSSESLVANCERVCQEGEELSLFIDDVRYECCL